MTPQLTAAVAHDLKNRLVLLGEELSKLADLSLSEAARQHVDAANEQAMLLTNKLVELLTVQSASDEQGLRASPQEEVPELFLEDVHADALRLTVGRVDLVKHVGDTPPFWFFDRQLVRLAIDSALYNALRFASSRITLGVRMDDDRLCFYVHDDGPGVQSTPCATSTGLGTAVCAQVAQAHSNRGRHGDSRLHNHHNGGAVFELHLP